MANMKRQFILEGLCCGNCAAKIQNDIRLLDGVRNAEVNTDTAILSVEFDMDSESLVKNITRITASHDENIAVKNV